MIWEDSIPGKIGFNSEDSLEQDASEFDKKEIHYRLEKLGVRMHKSTYERINDYDFDERLNSIFIFYEYSNSDEPKYLMLRGH